jgi:DNA-binding Lrp family transcriptional regulator
MFDKLLALLKRGGALTIEQAARELDTTPEVVSGMIDHMTRAGWLRSLSASCDARCGECLAARHCTRPGNNRIWSAAGEGRPPGGNG